MSRDRSRSSSWKRLEHRDATVDRLTKALQQCGLVASGGEPAPAQLQLHLRVLQSAQRWRQRRARAALLLLHCGVFGGIVFDDLTSGIHITRRHGVDFLVRGRWTLLII